MTVVPGPGDFFRLINTPSTVRKWLRYDIPTEYRYYDKNEDHVGHWHVHSKYLLKVIELAYRTSGPVDYSSLDDYVQMDIARAKDGWKMYQKSKTERPQAIPSSLTLKDSYATLHLLPSASAGVVAAVWRSLAKETHPDRGGDAELFRKYSEAYHKIMEEEKK